MGNATLINWVVLLISLATLMPTLVSSAHAAPGHRLDRACRQCRYSSHGRANYSAPPSASLRGRGRGGLQVTANALGDIVAASKTGMPEKFKDVNGQVSSALWRAGGETTKPEPLCRTP